MPKPYEYDRENMAQCWRSLLKSEDVQDLIHQAHSDAAFFRRNRKFPEEPKPE